MYTEFSPTPTNWSPWYPPTFPLSTDLFLISAKQTSTDSATEPGTTTSGSPPAAAPASPGEIVRQIQLAGSEFPSFALASIALQLKARCRLKFREVRNCPSLLEIKIVFGKIIGAYERCLGVDYSGLILANSKSLTTLQITETRTDLVVESNRKRIAVDLASELYPTDRNNEISVLQARDFVHIIVTDPSIEHGTQNVQVHVFPPFLSVSDLANYTILGNLWINMYELLSCWI
ncbi:hypothetical protein B0H13DRAFT_1897708 [Mycena leptocephala]|nr:hypothetical protein B0H13DRAFT_1897708 [Mycena leptocephala]